MRPYPVTQNRVQLGHHGQTGLRVQQRVEVEPSIEPESVLLQPWTPGQDNSVVRVLPLKTENVALQNVHNGQNGVHGRLAAILVEEERE